MPAAVTLASTTLTYGVEKGTGEIVLSSVSDIVVGYRLWIDRELMKVKALSGGTRVQVFRGVDGTAASRHSSSAVVTIGRADQFYATDPMGAPGEVILVSPYINVINGKTWYAQGDSLPVGLTNRWWQEVTPTFGAGALGVRTFESTPSSST